MSAACLLLVYQNRYALSHGIEDLKSYHFRFGQCVLNKSGRVKWIWVVTYKAEGLIWSLRIRVVYGRSRFAVKPN